MVDGLVDVVSTAEETSPSEVSEEDYIDFSPAASLACVDVSPLMLAW
jgi:hypothetical protein